jgi:hypothetical protein
MEPLRHVDAGVLNIANCERRPEGRTGRDPATRFSYDILCYVDVVGRDCRVIVPLSARLRRDASQPEIFRRAGQERRWEDSKWIALPLQYENT